MKIFIDRKYAAVAAAALYTAAFAVILSCGCTDDGLAIAFLKDGGQFNQSVNYSSFKDSRDGKTYKTAKIGGLTWMAENLNFKTDSGSLCHDNKNIRCDIYGRLYTFNAASSACDSINGWHLPSRAEWDMLVNYAGGEGVAGRKLKSKRGWGSYEAKSGNGTDDFGFSALPGGCRSYNSPLFYDFGGFWWSATGDESGNAYLRAMSDNGDGVYEEAGGGEGELYSVRCVAAVDPTVTIDGLTWMQKNLNIETLDSWCYGEDPARCEIYGRLYTWEAAKSACVSMGDGWRLPDTADWNKLVNYADGEDVAGKKLKSKSGWNNNGNGTDDYGFSAMPGGSRFSHGHFLGVGGNGFWWSAAEDGSDGAYYRNMDYSYDSVSEGTYSKSDGFSARCVKDEGSTTSIREVERRIH